MRTKVVSIFQFFHEPSNKEKLKPHKEALQAGVLRLYEERKIKKLRPKMTKIASNGSCLKATLPSDIAVSGAFFFIDHKRSIFDWADGKGLTALCIAKAIS